MIVMSKINNVTVVVPVKNEQQLLQECLSELVAFREVVVVDSGSTDDTVEIAERNGATVVQFRWTGSFPKKRNWVLENYEFKTDWILFLDADEIVSSKFCSELHAALDCTSHNGFWLSYTTYFMGQELKYGLRQRKLALIRLGKGFYENIPDEGWTNLDMEVHEHPIISGTVGTIKAFVDHKDGNGLSRYLKKHLEYAIWEANRYFELLCRTDPHYMTSRQRFKYRHITKWWFPYFTFSYIYFCKLGFLDGRAGFYFAALKARYFSQIKLLIWERAQTVRLPSK